MRLFLCPQKIVLYVTLNKGKGLQRETLVFTGVKMYHILLVEDNPGDVFMVRETIRHYGIAADVTAAYDGEGALRVLNSPDSQPNVVILDLNIPKLNGLEVLERTRRLDRPPVIVFTSSTNPQDRMRAMSLGAREYLVKPTDLNTYMDVLQGALQRWTNGSG